MKPSVKFHPCTPIQTGFLKLISFTGDVVISAPVQCLPCLFSAEQNGSLQGTTQLILGQKSGFNNRAAGHGSHPPVKVTAA